MDFSNVFLKRIKKVGIFCVAMLVLAAVISCSREDDSYTFLPYATLSTQAQQVKYGYYKCHYAHYRDGVPVSGSEDIFTVPAGTVISYDGFEHCVAENEVFNADAWFEEL